MISIDSNLQRLKSRIFTARGRRPYARGYGSYRQMQLQKYLSTGLPSAKLPDGWGLWLDERLVEYPWFFSRLPYAAGKLLDAGSVLNNDYILRQEKLQNKSLSIFTLAPESENHCNRGISYVYGDLRNTCYRDDYFDWVVSISTLEHVGMNNTRFYTNDISKNESNPESYMLALAELRRILRSGGVLYITLPFGRRQNLGWMQVFDSPMVHRLTEAFGPASCRAVYFRYKTSGWQIASQDECSDAGYFDLHSQGTTAGADIAAAESVVCLELTK